MLMDSLQKGTDLTFTICLRGVLKLKSSGQTLLVSYHGATKLETRLFPTVVENDIP